MLRENVQKRPLLEMLSQTFLERIVAEAIEVLSKVGVFVENKEALTLLGDAGARIDQNRRVLLPEDLVWRCVRSAPSPIQIFDRQGEPSMLLEGLNVHFDPGSAALKILDHRTGEVVVHGALPLGPAPGCAATVDDDDRESLIGEPLR